MDFDNRNDKYEENSSIKLENIDESDPQSRRSLNENLFELKKVFNKQIKSE